uniref:Uncharacterized protein n=1 Tax=viral metagenome TaxID=1070528 RepID=A0A6M3IQX1_9ZZZZ
MAYAVSAQHTLDKMILDALDVTGQTVDVGETGKIVTSTDGRKYKKCVVDASAVVSGAGEPAYYMVGTTANEVTSDYSDAQVSEQLGATFAGVFTAVVTGGVAEYVWIEVPNGAVTPDCSCATEVGVCDGLTAQNDSYFSISASDSDRVVAVAMEAASSNLADIVMMA